MNELPKDTRSSPEPEIKEDLEKVADEVVDFLDKSFNTSPLKVRLSVPGCYLANFLKSKV